MARKSQSSSKGNPRKRRRKDQLSSSLKKFSSQGAIWHLFGNSLKHALDALLSQEWQEEQSRKKLLKKIPKALHPRVEALVKQVRKYQDRLGAILTDDLGKAGFAGAPATVMERLTVSHMAEGRFGPGEGKLVFNMAKLGEPEQRAWQEVGELEWGDFLNTEMESRRHYVTEDRHHKTDEPGLWNLYARLAPWLAEVVGEKLEAMGNEGKAALAKIIVELADEFSAELGVDVLGLAVHREKNGDLHVHLIFSESKEVKVSRDLPKREFEALVSATARRRMEEGDQRGFKELRKVVKTGLEAAGEGQEMVVEMQRRRFPRPVQVLGPAFSGKLALWLASGKHPDVAAQGDRAAETSRSFRGRIVTAVERGDDLTKKFIDHWAAEHFRQKIEAMLSAEEMAQVRHLAKASVSRYRQTGSKTPSIESYITGEMATLGETLPVEVRKDLEKRATELDEREKEVSRRERAVSEDLPSWLLALVDSLPKRMLKNTAKESLEGLIPTVKKLTAVRERVEKVLIKMAIMKAKDWQALIASIAKLLGVRGPSKEKVGMEKM